jgi:phage terminase Nu1 subunit (DNA packaging protein)
MANTVKIDKVCPNVFGISVRRYQQLAKESILPPSDNGYIDFVLATKHLISYYQKLVEGQGSITLTEERARLARVQADLATLEYQKAQGKLVDADEVERIWIAMGQACRSRLLSIPAKLPPLLEGKSKVECQGILRDHIYEALDELSERLADPDFPIEPETAVDEKASLKKKGKKKAASVKQGD